MLDLGQVSFFSEAATVKQRDIELIGSNPYLLPYLKYPNAEPESAVLVRRK